MNNEGGSEQNSSAASSAEEMPLLSPPTTEQLNMRCTGVKRLLKEAVELRQPNELFCAKPMEDNLFEWHFSVRGPPDTVYASGVYHGRIVLPAEYPMKPPNLILLTPNGRFETNKKICLSISGYHPETWLPSWSIRTALLALVGFMPTHSAGALGGLECSQEERRRLALKSLDWSCPHCGIAMRDALPPMGGDSGEGAVRLMAEAKNAVAPSPAVAAAVKKQPSVEETAADNQPKRINAEEVEAGTGTSLAMAADEDEEIHHMAQPSCESTDYEIQPLFSFNPSSCLSNSHWHHNPCG